MQNHRVEQALEALKKDFVIVGKTRVRSWHAWLIIGVAVGITAGILFVANRSGEFEASRASVVCDDFGCYEDAVDWYTYDPGIDFFEPDFYVSSFDDFDFNDFAAENIGVALDDFNEPIFNAFYAADSAAALNVSENLIENFNRADIADPSEWLDENVDSRLSAIGVPENQIGLIDNAQILASPEDFLNADDETIDIIGFDPNNSPFEADDFISITDEKFNQNLKGSGLNLNQDFFPGHPNVSLVIGELDGGLISQWKNALSKAYENATPAIQSLAEQNSFILLNRNEFDLFAEPLFGISNQSDNSPAFQLGDTYGEGDWPKVNGSSVICADCALTAFQLSQRPWQTDQKDFPEAVFIHELIHLDFDDFADQEAFDIFSEAHGTFEGASCPSPHACDSPTELFAAAAEAYTITNGSFSPVLPSSPAYKNWQRQINWLLRRGRIKPIVFASGSSFNLFNRAYAQLSTPSYVNISNMSFGQGMFRLPDIGLIDSSADTARTLVPEACCNKGLSKGGASPHVISESAVLIRDISEIALKISEFGVEQAKKYAAAGKDVAAQDQAAGAASILVALDDYAKYSKAAKEIIRAYVNVPGAKDALDENPSFLKTTFVSSAQLKQKTPSSLEVQNTDPKARMFFTAAQYLSANLSAISTLASYQTTMEQYFNIQTVAAAVYTERSKKIEEDVKTMAENKALINSANTGAKASVASAEAIYAGISKIAATNPQANTIVASALSEVNKIKSASAVINSAALSASNYLAQNSAALNSIKPIIATLPDLISKLQKATTNAIYNEAIFIDGVRQKLVTSTYIVNLDKLKSDTNETVARQRGSYAVEELKQVSDRLNPASIKDTKSLAYYYWSVSLGAYSSLKANSVEPVMSKTLPDLMKKTDQISESNADLNEVNKLLADIDASMQMLKKYESQAQAFAPTPTPTPTQNLAPTECSDGISNEQNDEAWWHDELIDMADPQCSDPQDNTEVDIVPGPGFTQYIYSPNQTPTPTFNFTLTNGGNKSVIRGSATSNTITATLSSGIAQSTVFTVSGLPTGASGTFSPTSCSPICTTTLNISTQSTTPTGNSTITITSSAGSVTKTSTFTLTVNATNPTPTPTSTPTPTPVVSTKFALNDRVQVSSGSLNVRSTANGTILGTQATGALGTVIGGPTNSGGFNWWNINFDSGVDGWSAEDFLVKYVAPAPTPTPTPTQNLAPTECSDGISNEQNDEAWWHDELIDMADPQCSDPQDNTEVDIVPGPGFTQYIYR